MNYIFALNAQCIYPQGNMVTPYLDMLDCFILIENQSEIVRLHVTIYCLSTLLLIFSLIVTMNTYNV